MKSIISLLFFFFICAAFANDEIEFDNQGPDAPLKCSNRLEYKACLTHCLQSGFKKAICKNNQCECADDNNMEPSPYENGCQPEYCDFMCKKYGLLSGSCLPNDQCQCFPEKLQKPFEDFEETEVDVDDLDADLNCSTLGEYYKCYEHCKKSGFFLPYCKDEKCSCIHDKRKEYVAYDDEIERNPRLTCQINKWLCNKHCELHNFRYGICNENHICVCYK
ncbi:hypothetical protein PVAND_013129 [Polypedilum vanderplanki]|uniref:Invertebrate defensins family profile domain-containing protein n=1 Tax=Polypedilum vanderplanki TaxID=319348 RepID=A0A9J6CPP6_POLVA|nr:hypothetical protein PVAND_013129 [Polypedilum vanderplanki]